MKHKQIINDLVELFPYEELDDNPLSIKQFIQIQQIARKRLKSIGVLLHLRYAILQKKQRNQPIMFSSLSRRRA